MTKKDDKLMHHDYDGIQELDNDMPSWWLWLFYISIFWAVIYMLHYHVLGTGDLQIAEYNKEYDSNWTPPEEQVAKSAGLFYYSPFYSSNETLTPRMEKERLLAQQKLAEEEAKREEAIALAEGREIPGVSVSQLNFDDLIKEAMRKANPNDLGKLQEAFPEIYASLSEEGQISGEAIAEASSEPAEPTLVALTDAASLQTGENIYQKNCASCHGNLGQGGIGPNMTDDYWIHGAGIDDVVRILNVGVAAKGMISWKPILSEQEILQVASFVLKLHGTNPPNGKKPQGEKIDYPL